MDRTIFYKGSEYLGLGINTGTEVGSTLSNYLRNLNSLRWGRIAALCSNIPGLDGIYYTNEAFDNMWSFDIGKTISTFSALRGIHTTIIFTLATTPDLIFDFTGYLTGDYLVAYARYFASAIKVHNNAGLMIEWVDLLPDNIVSFISPENLVVFLQTFRNILDQRGIHGIKIMGPSLGNLMLSGSVHEQYIEIFKQTSGLLDAWSFSALENDLDKPLFNKGTFESRMYVYSMASKTVNLMKNTLGNIPIFASRFSTMSTRYSMGVDYGPMASEMPEFSIRLADNLCGLLSSGTNSVLFWNVFKRGDRFSFHRNNGSKRPQKEALDTLSQNMPFRGHTYTNRGLYPVGDQTVKGIVVDQNSFTMVLSRSTLVDAMAGQVKVDIVNSDWTDVNTVVLNFVAYPSYVDATGIQKITSVSTGVLHIDLHQVPYNCVILVRGSITRQNISIPPKQIKNINVHAVSVLPTGSTGDLVFYVVDQMLYVCGDNGVWSIVHV